MAGVQSALVKTNSSLKDTQSELKEVNKQLKFDPTNTELLAQKQTLLKKGVEESEKKLDSYNQMLEAHNKKMNEADHVTEEMEAEHRALVREIEKTKGQLQYFNEEQGKVEKQLGPIQKLKDVYEGVKDTITDVKSRHEILVGALEKTTNAAKKVGEVGFAVLKGAATGAVAAVGAVGTAAVAGAKKMVEMAGDMSSVGDEIDKQSQKMGVSAEQYQVLKLQAEHCGTSIEALSKANITLKKSGSDLDLQTAIKQIAAIKDPAERSAAAVEMFGQKTAGELAPMLNSGVAALDEIATHAKETGAIMSNDAVAASASYQDALTDLNATIGNTKNQLVANFLPGMTEVMEGITALFSGDADGAVKKIESGIDNIIGAMDTVIPAAIKILTNIVDVAAKEAPKIILTIVEGITGHLDELVGATFSIITTLTQSLLTPENIKAILGAAVNFLTSLVGFISENVDLVVDSAFQIIETLIDSLLADDNLQKLLGASLEIVVKLATGIIDHLPDLVNSAIELAKGLADTLIHYDWWGVVKKIWSSLTGGIKKLFKGEGGGDDGDTDGSHANGLAYVPWDGYRAELHQGERVLTRQEADDYRALLTVIPGGKAQQGVADTSRLESRLDKLESELPGAVRDAVKSVKFEFNRREVGRMVEEVSA